MSAGWKSLDTRNNSLIIGLLKDEDLDGYSSETETCHLLALGLWPDEEEEESVHSFEGIS